MAESKDDFETIRQIQTVLTLHFVDGVRQNEIAATLNLSTSKVNRLIAQGRKLGMLKISVESPFQRLIEIEALIRTMAGLSSAIVTPTVPAITGGKAIHALVEQLNPERGFDVTVVPLTGGVQGKHFTDVNHLATRVAERLGGRTMLLHAPLFAESRAQRDMLLDMAPVREVLDLARKASIALVGVGSILSPASSYYDLHPGLGPDHERLAASGAVGEFLAHLIRDDGKLADYALNDRLVALAPADLARCRSVIGVASGPEKVRPIRAALNGGYLKSLVLDEETANAVLGKNGIIRHVA